MVMAVGIIIGAAFTAIVTSLVNDIISPLLGLLVDVNFSGPRKKRWRRWLHMIPTNIQDKRKKNLKQR